MTATDRTNASRFDEIIADFADLDLRERLEVLLDYAHNLPPLPKHYQLLRDADGGRVHECMTPVFLWVEIEDGFVQIYADVAEEAPTVKGFVAILVEAFCGAEPREVVAVKPNLLQTLGLLDAVGMARMRGLSAIERYIRHEVKRQLHHKRGD